MKDFIFDMKTYGRQLVLSLMALCSVGVLLVSCHDDALSGGTDTTVPSNPDLMTINLKLTVPAAAGSTRAGGHDTEDGTDAENYINVEGGDYTVLIFGKNGTLIKRASDDEFQCERNPGSGNNVEYTLRGSMDITDATTREQLSTFRVMVLANWKSFDNTNYSTKFTNEHTLDGIYTDGDNFNFTMPHSVANSSTSSWLPSMSAPVKAIPMFGISGELKLGEDVMDKAQHGYEPFYTCNISMLRSIAKVEIVDNISNNEISAVKLSRYNATGRYIPNILQNIAWDKEAQIVTPTLPNTPSSLSNLSFHRETRDIDGLGRLNVWVAYIPEMDLTSDRPTFHIELGGKAADIDFNNYSDGSVDATNPLEAVLRNHIYRYTVTGASANLSVNLNVMEWDMETEEDVHFDLPAVKLPEDFDESHPTYPYHLTWTLTKEDPDNPGEWVDNGYVDDPVNCLLLMKPGMDDYAECQFTLSAPLNATWIAKLIPLQGDHAAFELHEDFSSGKIDGQTPAVVKIRNTTESVADERNEARLVIMVEYPDKTQKEVFVVQPNENNLTNYTIVQQKTVI